MIAGGAGAATGFLHRSLAPLSASVYCFAFVNSRAIPIELARCLLVTYPYGCTTEALRRLMLGFAGGGEASGGRFYTVLAEKAEGKAGT